MLGGGEDIHNLKIRLSLYNILLRFTAENEERVKMHLKTLKKRLYDVTGKSFKRKQ